MNRRGFALFAVLWVITALAALTGAGLTVARLGSETTRNRVLLARAEWAREACGEILQARFAGNRTLRVVAPIDLGRGTWCRASLVDPGARLNVNTADTATLRQILALVGKPDLADSIVVARRSGPIYDLRAIPGVDSALAGPLEAFVTTRGTGAVNVNTAPVEILRLLPGVNEEAALLLESRRPERPLHSADELAGALSPAARSVLMGSYAEFVRATVFEPPQLIGVIEGGVRGTPIVARATLTLVPVPGRLAVIRRETE